MNHPPMDDSCGESFDSPNQIAASPAKENAAADPYRYAREQYSKGMEPKEIGKHLRAAGYSAADTAQILCEMLKRQQGGQAHAGAAPDWSRCAILIALMFLMSGMILKCLGATGPIGTTIFLLLDFAGFALILRGIVQAKNSRRNNRRPSNDYLEPS